MLHTPSEYRWHSQGLEVRQNQRLLGKERDPRPAISIRPLTTASEKVNRSHIWVYNKYLVDRSKWYSCTYMLTDNQFQLFQYLRKDLSLYWSKTILNTVSVPNQLTSGLQKIHYARGNKCLISYSILNRVINILSKIHKLIEIDQFPATCSLLNVD